MTTIQYGNITIFVWKEHKSKKKKIALKNGFKNRENGKRLRSQKGRVTDGCHHMSEKPKHRVM